MRYDGAATPRVIWFYWRQGIGAAPPVVRMCYRSWILANPGWEVRLLDSTTVGRYAMLPAWGEKLTPQQYSDLLRLQLLADHGGVWVDATTYCNSPLDDWLPSAMPAGFFAFARPNAGQRLDSWFLAAAGPGSAIVEQTLDFLTQYFRVAPPPDTGGLHTLLRKAVYRALSRSTRTSEWWFAKPVRVGLRLAPYYAIHYAFNRTIRRDPVARATWLRTPEISADGPHLFWKHGLDKPADAEMMRELAQPSAPLYKLTWKSPALDDPATALGGFVAEHAGGDR